MRLRTLVAMTTTSILLATAVGVGGAYAAADATGRRLAVEGFQSEGDPRARIDASARALSIVGVDGVSLTASGATFDYPDSDARSQLARAHARHLRAEFLVSNFSDEVGDFSEPLAWRLLGSAAHRAAVAARLASAVRTQGWDGVNVDLESLAARDRPGLTDLLRRIRADLPRGRTLSIDLMADSHRASYAAMGYDVRAINRVVDRIALMTYDQHGPWEDTPGPVGSLYWTRQCLAALLADGASRSRTDLGIAGYGYAWRPHSNDTLTDPQAVALVRAQHAHAIWSVTAAEWTATLPDGSTVWWSDTRSYRARYAYAAAQHLHGVAVWSLGQSDPIPVR